MKNYFASNRLIRTATLLLFFAIALQFIAPLSAYADTVENETTVSDEGSVEESAPEPEEEEQEAEETVEQNDESPAPAEEEEQEAEEPEVTAVVTGDATAGVDIENVANTNEIDTNATAEEVAEPDEELDETIPEENSTSTEEAAPEALVNEAASGGGGGGGGGSESDADIINDNTATSTTDATSSAVTGENEAGSASTTETIVATGDAVAYVDVLNVINTNIINSDGLVDFINETLGYENVDLRDAFLDIFSPTTAQSTTPCGLNFCGDGSTSYTIESSNIAEIVNNITVGAITGENRAEGINATITTGDAYATANIVNVANTNVVDSNYLLLVFNNYSDYAGSLVLPNSDFFSTLLANAPGGTGSVTNTNTANVTNNVGVGAETGGNTAEGGVILTGDSYANANVDNTLNQNYFNTGSFSMLIRVHGDWTGEIFGLPDGMSWEYTAAGIRIYSTGDGGGTTGGNTVTNNNVANITNNVQVYALTGDNQAVGASAGIATGNAYADANIYNMANTNIIGSNWANLIFNIYGNWNGNIAFGEPDLWLGLSVEANGGLVRPGSTVTYTYTIFNRGDATARDVRLENRFFEPGLDFTGDPENLAPTGHLTWSIGDIPAGGTKEFSYEANVTGEGGSSIPLTARAYGLQPDANDEDNEDTVVVDVTRLGGRSGNWTNPSAGSDFTIFKEANRRAAQPGDSVDYTVTFKNKGGTLYDAVLVDTMRNEEGDIIHEEFWELGEIPKGQSIQVDYTIELPKDMKFGTYTNSAQLIGLHGNERGKYRTPYKSPIAEHDLAVGEEEEGEVLGACAPYLTTYMRFGQLNDPSEVKKLQRFLNEHTGSTLSESGLFDRATEVAVRGFQNLYADEILTPWGLTRDSGYVYYTTQKKVNELMCGGSDGFALTDEQKMEMLAFRALHEAFAKSRPAPVLPDDIVLPLVGLEDTPLKPEIVEVPEEPAVKVVTEKKPAKQSIPQERRSLFAGFVERIGNWFDSLTPDDLIVMR